MVRLERHRREWDELARLDSLRAICRREAEWELPEFLETGEHDVERMLRVGADVRLPQRNERALDFGCGVGRLARALASRFGHVDGVDISEEMIRRARELNRDRPRLTFTTSAEVPFADETFDFVCSLLVLQHLPSRELALHYVREFVRVLRQGGLAVFQVPTALPPSARRQLRRRAYALLRAARVPERWLYERANLNPIRTLDVAHETIKEAVADAGGKILRRTEDDAATMGIESHHYYVGRRD